ncbi:DUF6082 family protein [Phytohabitans sp. LJ34]|uniref:DUF6082 family protein n=1 Tax=Phytohabitans sp. LJ34 TaxID=3452217 RepID=UPI003F8A9114
MKTPRFDLFPGFRESLGKIGVMLAVAAASIAIFVGAALTPSVIASLDSGDREWVAALVATLLVVAASTMLQRKQVRHERLWLQRGYTFDLLRMAMDDPIYAQCWGPRVSPPDMDERLFYYANLVIMGWSYAWEHGQIDAQQVRAYAQAFFESEVSREYWTRYGSWRSRSRGRERAFYRIIDNEYRDAIAGGPPTRPYEPSTIRPESAARAAISYRRRRHRRSSARRVERITAVGRRLRS